MGNNKNFKEYWKSLVSFIINHVVWSILIWVFSFVTLNIPFILNIINSANKYITSYSGILSVVSIFITVIFLIILIREYVSKFRQGTSEKTTTQETAETKSLVEPTNKIPKEKNHDTLNIDLIDSITFEEFKVELYLKSRTEIIYKLSMSGIVNSECLNCFSKELTWSGSKYIKTEVYGSNVGDNIDDNVGNRTKSPYKYTLCFDSTKYRGDPVTFSFKTFALDEEKNMIPISMFHVKYPIEKLTMILSVDNSVKIRNIRKTGYNDTSRESKYFTPQKLIGEDYGNLTKYSYSVNRPTAWKHYAIEWDFEP